MYQVVLDTNVLVAALRWRSGASHRLLETLGDSHWRPNVTVAIVLEYEAVLKRNCREFGLTEEDVDDVVDAICSQAGLHRLYFSGGPSRPIQMTIWCWRPQLPATVTSSSPSINGTFQTPLDSEFGV